jgi:hypothetical protein
MRSVNRWIAVLLTTMLAACGGGGGEVVARIGGGGSGAPLTVGVGTVGGFGSIIVNGQSFDETGAQFLVDERPDQPAAASVDVVRLGMQLQYEHQSGRMTQATVAAEVIGPVTSVAAAGLTVLGQTVRVNVDPALPTVYDGFATLADLGAGATVEVHGQRNAAGEIAATRIERRAAAPLLRVAGTVADLAGGSFRIGALRVQTAQAAIVPAGQALANGQRVAVWTDLPLASGELVARVVRIGGLTFPANAVATIDGTISDFQSASSLRVAGVAVDASAAQFVGGGAADLRNGRAVRATGPVSGGLLRATRVEFLAAAAVSIQLSGPVNGYVDAASAFRVRNAAARVTAQTTYVGGDATNLGNGAQVKAEGPLVNGVVEIARLEFLPPPPSIARALFGTVGAPVTVAGETRTFRLTPLPFDVRATAATRFKKGVATDLVVGRGVKVDGSYDGAVFVADEIQFMDNVQDPPTFTVDGIASNVQPDAVVVNGTRVGLTPATTYRKGAAAATFADLVNGVTVAIEALRVNGELVASIVEIKETATGSASVRGLVSQRDSASDNDILVGSQRVSLAGSPQLIPGNRTLADIRNGIDLEVDGTIAGGLLTASRIKFR